MDPRIVRTRLRPLGSLLAVALILTAAAPLCFGADAPVDTLVLVNGDPITTLDFDTLIMAAHADFRAGDRSEASATQILDKRVNDYLLIQDAMAAGYDEEEAFLALIAEKTQEYAIGVYVQDNVDLPASAPADSVRAFFDRYYWQIQLRRISVRTREEAESLRAKVAQGADMEALARELSLDTKNLNGGLYNLLYWADVENRLRDEVRGLKAGDLSAVFPYNDAFTFVRIEKLLPVDEAAFARFERSIIPVVHGQLRQRAWDTFLAEQTAKAQLREDVGGLMAIMADSAVVLTGDFLIEQPGFVFEIEDGDGVTGTALRRAISHEAMQKSLEPFGRHLTTARHDLTSELVLASLAKAAGYYENDEVLAMVEKDWEKELIARYLDDHVTSRIVFKREEFEALYEQNKELMRGPEEVRIDVMIFDDVAEAMEASQRLSEGADFGFIFEQYNEGQEIAVGASPYISINELSKPFRDGLRTLDVGESSSAIEMPMGYMVFRLDARRPGSVPPIEAVEMDLRRALFKRNFDKGLIEHLAILKEGSDITWYPEKIEAYMSPAKEGP